MKYYYATTNPYPDGPFAGDGEYHSLSLNFDRPGRFPRDWGSGGPFKHPPSEPVEAIVETAGTRFLDFYDSSALIVSAPLHEIFDEAGVRTVDWYPLVIRCPATDSVRHDFSIGNVTRAIPTDEARHREGPYKGLNMFQCLKRLEDVIGGARLFRQSEVLSQIVVHQTVVDLVTARLPKAIRFERVNFTV